MKDLQVDDIPDRDFLNDAIARRGVTFLVIFQVSAFFIGCIFIFRRLPKIALTIAFISIILLVGALILFYICYRKLPIVQEKRKINNLEATIRDLEAEIKRNRQNWKKVEQGEEKEENEAREDHRNETIESGMKTRKIKDAFFNKIGPGQRKLLEEHGFFTAADITKKVKYIKGIGKIETQELMEWQERVKFESRPKSWDQLPEGYDRIKKKYQIYYERHKAEQDRLQEEKINKENARDDILRRIYQPLEFTFRSYLRKGLASKGRVAGIMGVILVLCPICLGTSALLGIVKSSPTVAASIQNLGIAGLTPSNTPTNNMMSFVHTDPSITVSATPIPEAVATSTPIAVTTTAPLTSIQDATATSLPSAPTATVTLAATNPAGPLVVTFIDVEQGDSILIAAPNGRTVLIDGGSAGSGALPYLQNHGIKGIDIMIATHPDEDHIGGLVEILNAMQVKKVITDGESDTTTTYERFLDAIVNAKAKYEVAGRGDRIDLDNLHFLVLNPAKLRAEDVNTNSLVLRMSYGKTTFVFMGDADTNAEQGILAAGLPVQADILKVGHHGSCESSSPAFLDAVHPQVAIYSAGINNPYGHPCAGTISALNARGVFVYGTDTNGSVAVTVAADGYSITNSNGLIFRR